MLKLGILWIIQDLLEVRLLQLINGQSQPSSNQECEEADQTFLIGKSPLRATGSGFMSGQSKIGISNDKTNDKMFKDYVCVKGK